MKKVIRFVILLLVGSGIGYYAWLQSRPRPLILTGIVTTHDVVLSPQIGGRLDQLLVVEGDIVHKGQLVAVIASDELREEQVFYTATAEGASSQVRESEAALRFQQMQTADQIAQAEATLASIESQKPAADAELENARSAYDRAQRMSTQGISTIEQLDQTRTAFEVAKSRLTALGRQIEAQRASVALARSNAEQVAIRRSQLQATQRQQAAANAQRAKAGVRLAYAELHAPIDGIVDVRAARQGEVVTAGQPVVTLINLDDLWVRADVEETYVDRLRIGDTFTVRLPSGEERPGTVFYRGVDAGFATQRDVSRTKRDIKTFQLRLRVDNADRKLASGMTAYVVLPVM
ncbi:MAG: efflux RND transporter periplasmic adaptor subunit [Vicinamibacterales bacterium]